MMKMKLGTTDKNELIIFDEKAESEVFASMSIPRQAEGKLVNPFNRSPPKVLDQSYHEAQMFDLNDGMSIGSGEFDYDISGLDCDEMRGGSPSV